MTKPTRECPKCGVNTEQVNEVINQLATKILLLELQMMRVFLHLNLSEKEAKEFFTCHGTGEIEVEDEK